MICALNLLIDMIKYLSKIHYLYCSRNNFLLFLLEIIIIIIAINSNTLIYNKIIN